MNLPYRQQPDGRHCDLEQGEIQVEAREDIAADLAVALSGFFRLRSVQSVRIDRIYRSKIVTVENGLEKDDPPPPFFTYPNTPPAFRWLVAVPFVKDKLALCAFVAGWTRAHPSVTSAAWRLDSPIDEESADQQIAVVKGDPS